MHVDSGGGSHVGSVSGFFAAQASFLGLGGITPVGPSHESLACEAGSASVVFMLIPYPPYLFIGRKRR